MKGMKKGAKMPVKGEMPMKGAKMPMKGGKKAPAKKY